VLDISANDFVERDLLLVKISAPAGGVRTEVRELVDIFRGQIVDVGPDEVMIEISGRESKVQAFIERVRPYGIRELVRTGRIAMVRSDSQQHAANSSPLAESTSV
jgi:acetolactate synthase-1/3 small subunit